MELLLDMILGISISVGIGLLWVRASRGRTRLVDRNPADEEAGQAVVVDPVDHWDWNEEELPVAEEPAPVLREEMPPIWDVPAPQTPATASRKLRVELRERAERIHELERTVGSLSTRFRSCMGRDPDSLQILRGIGPGYEKALAEQGIHTVPQLAALQKSDQRRMKKDAPALYRRLCAMRWIEQARELMQGSEVVTS